ncbi:MAG: amidohydrolase family protein [Candidatus Tectomicrobia bacterium]|nr:amidohydrolase family protein [Candidatus Tectomicrobia bacterium]
MLDCFDLLITNGILVSPELGMLRAEVAIAGGKIAAIAEPGVVTDVGRVIDAGGNYVLPGFIDPHVHFGNRRPISEEIVETKSAIAGGITTLGAYLRNRDGSYFDTFPEALAAVEKLAHTDVLFHFQIFHEHQLQEITRYAHELGVTSFKFYMYGAPNISRSVDDAFLLRAFRLLAELGHPAIACVHAENEAIVTHATAAVMGRPHADTLEEWEATHPAIAEEEAVARAALLAEAEQARLYIVHLSSKGSVVRLRAIRDRYPEVHVEVTSIHLSLTQSHPYGLYLKRQPPHRDASHLEALWQGVRDGVIDTFGTDNITSLRSMNQPEKGLLGARAGFPSLATHVPILLTEGYRKRGIPLQRIVQCGSTRPAQTFGIYPQKGSLVIGSDADLVIVDVEHEAPVTIERLHSWGDHTPYEGEMLTGWPIVTIKGGKVAFENNRVTSEDGCGRYLRRAVRR